MAPSPGVFSLDQLRALGQTGDLTTDLTREGRLDYLSNIQALEAFRKKQEGVDAIRAGIPPGTKAGYYQVPGQQGAEYYDPTKGNVSEELATYLASGKDQFGAAPTPIYSGDAGDVHRQSESQGLARRAGSIFDNAANQGISLQDAQDQLNGTGAYQKFVMGTDGKMIAMKDVPTTNLHPDVGFVDLTGSNKGAFDRLVSETGGDPVATGKLFNAAGNDYNYYGNDAELQARADYWKNWGKEGSVINYKYEQSISREHPDSPAMQFWSPEEMRAMGDVNYWKNLRDSVAANYERQMQASQGLGQNRVNQGLDPRTGTSPAETKRIFDTYNRIVDPAQKSMFIKYQDPGNLTDALKLERAAARAPEDSAIAAANKQYETTDTTHWYQDQYYPGEVKITSGAQIVNDPQTGRSAFQGHVPYKLDYTPPKDSSKSFAGRLGGAIAGGFAGGIGGMGNPFAIAAGIWTGAGGWMPNASSIGLKKGGLGVGSGFSGGTWSGGKMAQGPQLISSGIKAFMFQAVLGSASAYAKGGIGKFYGPNVMGPTPGRYGAQF